MTPLRIAVVIASVGRPAELERWIDHVQRQTRKPDQLVFSVANRTADLPPPERIPAWVTVRVCAPGLPVQRNSGLQAAGASSDIIAFFDDDYVPSIRCVEEIERLFQTMPDIVGATGVLLADGINSAGISYEEALQMVASHDARPPSNRKALKEVTGLYGCNMVYRVSAIGDECFDEQLPLYAWQEDNDFSARLGRKGRLVKARAICGVHQGVKGGRIPGVRLGYSQIVNPIYLARKGTMKPWYAGTLMLRNVLMNHAKMLFPEPWVDRAGRAKGNWLAFLDVMTRRDHPKNVLAIK